MSWVKAAVSTPKKKNVRAVIYKKKKFFKKKTMYRLWTPKLGDKTMPTV